LIAAWLLGALMIKRRAKLPGVLLITLTVLPLLIFLPVSARISIFSPKYAIAMLPVVFVGVAAGLSALIARSRVLGAVGLACVLGFSSFAHYRDLTEPAVQREHWNWISDYLRQNAQPDDQFIVFADYAEPVFRWHFDRANANRKIYRFVDDPMNPEPVFDKLQADPKTRTIWLIMAHDQVARANHRLLDVAAQRYAWTHRQYPNNGFLRVMGYATQWRHTALPASATPYTARFANGLELVGARVNPTTLAPTDKISHPPSNWIHVVTYWRRWKPFEAPHVRPFLRLIGNADAGEWGGELSYVPNVFEYDPPGKWDDGTLVEYHFDVNLNPITPAGEYTLVIGLEADDKSRTPLAQTNEIVFKLAPIAIIR
jgi:hypothetical protein